MADDSISIIDLFAGPGGLSEGFSAYRTADDTHPFRVRLSVEMDPPAHATLKLRRVYRHFRDTKVPEEYYDHLRGRLSLDGLYAAHPEAAKAAEEEAWNATLGEVDASEVRQRIKTALNGAKKWALIGGPPCQAYSLVGRARRTNDAAFENDKKHLLYREYLRIIADHCPPVFVMENVKGLLSATHKGTSTFLRILADLKQPCHALGRTEKGQKLTYRIRPLVRPVTGNGVLFDDSEFHPSDHVVACEDYGIPQCRHRIILLGIRSDLKVQSDVLTRKADRVSMWKAICDLPKLRSALSEGEDGFDDWCRHIRSAVENGVLDDPAIDEILRAEMRQMMPSAKRKLTTGGKFIPWKKCPRYAKHWYFDPRLKGICNHSARSHITEDLYRYLFVSCYGRVMKVSPKLRHFPAILLPEHKNVEIAIRTSLFSDRFRVQIRDEPATTVTSHIAKDGHYFIHPDPRQCRSLTVREAARLQTFPDNYFFEGNRTQQYQQVGNAVPPLLARQIAAIVYDVLERGMGTT